MVLDQKQKSKLKRFIRQLDKIRGRHTELVSVYIPAGYDLNKIISHLQQEQGTASNIKDKTTQKHVIDSLEKMIRHLRLFKQTPKNGLAVFSGNTSDKEGRLDIEVYSMEPPEPLNIRVYRCDQRFKTDILKEMMEYKEEYGLIVLDRREANIGLLKGTTVTQLVEMTSMVPGKTRAGGQCLKLGSLVQCSDGNIVGIEKLHNPYVLKSANFDSYSIEDSPILDKWETQKQIFYKIITKNPRLEIECSKDHLFFIFDEIVKEKAAEQLKVGDYLLTPERIEVKGKQQYLNDNYYNSYLISKKGREFLKNCRVKKSLFQKQLAKQAGLQQTTISFLEIGKRKAMRHENLKTLCQLLGITFSNFVKNYTHPNTHIKLPKKLNKDLAQVLGYLMGDGNIETDRLNFFERDKETALYYKKKATRLFNANSSLRFRDAKNYYELRLHGRPLTKMIKNEFPELKKARTSKIPTNILKSPNIIVACFLKGLFDAEGYVSSKKIGIGMNNKALVQQLQLLLLRFGILASFLEYDNRSNVYSNNTRYTLEISTKESLKLFQKHIGFSFKGKAGKLKGVIKEKADKESTRQILVDGKQIRRLIEKAGLNLQYFPKVNSFFRNELKMGKSTFKNSILKEIKQYQSLHDELKKFLNYRLLPAKINKIMIINEPTQMIDISTKSQNFIANGLIVHNSAQRFARLREGAAKEFFNKIAEAAQKEFLPRKNLKGIIIGGPGPTKEDFINNKYLNQQLADKIIAIKDISYTGEFGLKELVEKSQDILAKEAIAAEKQIMEKFFTLLAKQPNKVTFGLEQVKKALEMGAVDSLLISEELDDEITNQLEEIAEKFGATVFFISTDTGEGAQLKDIGKVAAILRFEIY